MQCPLCDSPITHSFETVRRPQGRFWRCGHCDLVAKDPSFFPDAAEERRIYDLHQNGGEGHRRFLAPVVEAVKMKMPAGARGLDWGSGPVPALAEMLSAAGYPTKIYDPLYAAEISQSPFEFITLTEVLEHFKTPGADLRRLRERLSPGGFLFIHSQFHSGGSDDDVQRFFENWGYRGDPTHVSFFSRATFASLGKNGWAVESEDGRLVILRKN